MKLPLCAVVGVMTTLSILIVLAGVNYFFR